MDLPELLAPARGVIKLHGLRNTEAGSHAVVWSTLTEGRQAENVPVTYTLAPDLATIFPKRKVQVRRPFHLSSPVLYCYPAGSLEDPFVYQPPMWFLELSLCDRSG